MLAALKGTSVPGRRRAGALAKGSGKETVEVVKFQLAERNNLKRFEAMEQQPMRPRAKNL